MIRDTRRVLQANTFISNFLATGRRAMSVATRLVALLFLQVTLKPCLAVIVTKPPKPKGAFDLIEPTVRILESCHESLENGIGVVGDPTEALVSSLKSGPHIPMVVIDGTWQPVDSVPVTSSKAHKLQLFLIMSSSSSQLQEHLANVKKSRWWNHMADFWLVEWPAPENDCANAYAFLWTAWRMNILEAKFICVHGTKGKLIYTFNPYTSYAPDPWRLENVYNGENEHPWSLLYRELSSAPEPCRNMSFDKADNLGGYEIRVTLWQSPFFLLTPNKTGIDAVECLACSGFRAILRSLNATVKLLVHGADEPLGSLDASGNADGILAETYYGISDIALQPNSPVSTPNLPRLRPYHFMEPSIMTQYSGSASQMKKIASLIDVTSRLGLLLVCLLTFIFLKYFLRQTSSIACLNLLRMICNSCLTKLPSRTSSRFYLGSLFFFVVTFQGIYQGALASLLAKRVALRNIENMEDLRQSDHTIYGHKEYGVLFAEPVFQGRFVGLESYNCTGHVLRNPSNACVRSRVALLRDAAFFRLHLSKDHISVHSMAFPIRQDWPLERKFNQKFQALFEANVFGRAYDELVRETLRIVEANDHENTDRGFKILNFDDLKFAFGILAIGLMIAAVTFVIEVIRA